MNYVLKIQLFEDCGIPKRQRLVLTPTKYDDAIGIHRRMHATCSEGYFQFGSGRLTCQSNGEWKYDILCEEKAGYTLKAIIDWLMFSYVQRENNTHLTNHRSKNLYHVLV